MGAALLSAGLAEGPQGGDPPHAYTMSHVMIQNPERPGGTLTVAIGDAVEARLTVRIALGFHIQANPPSQPQLIPALLELEADDGVELGPPVYPLGRPYRLHGATEDLSTYEGTVEIAVPVRTTPDARPGDHLLSGTFRYQACDARMCLRPATIPVELRVRLVPAG